MAPAYNASRQGRWILPIPIDLDTEELATFLIVTSLAAGAQHGYGIIADVLEISGGRVGCWPGLCMPPWTGCALRARSTSTAKRP